MVTALKVSTTASLSSACSAGAEIAASVKTKDSMVAMSGAIMPAPLAMPLMVTVALPMRACTVASFGNVSVVMMALAAAGNSSAFASATSLSMTPSKACAFNGSPMTPVEARKISAGLQPMAFEAICAVNLQASRPLLPVKALALPELTTSARALPPLRCARHHSTGADGHFDLVNTRRPWRRGRTAPAARRCGRHSGCRRRRWPCAHRRWPACPARAWGRGGKPQWT